MMSAQHAKAVGVMTGAPIERSKKSTSAKPKPQYLIAPTQLPSCDKETKEILSELGNEAKEEIASLVEHAKRLGVEISTFGLMYDHDEGKYGILVAYKGRENEPLEKRMGIRDKIYALNKYIKDNKSANFFFIGPV
jgi:hypothetical protein